MTYGSILMLAARGAWSGTCSTARPSAGTSTPPATIPDAARLAGINTDRTLLAVYTIAGLDLRHRRLGADRPHRRRSAPLSGVTANLDSITAVVIGGTSLFGGRGSIVGTLVGALIVGVFRNGLALAGADAVWQEFTVGLLIIVAVTIDQWIRRVSA